MGQPLEVHIRKLQEFYWSDEDPDGRGFVPLADALRRAGDLREAHRLLRDGLNRHPDYLSGHVVAGWLCLDQGQLGQAEDRFRTALELDPRNVAALRGLADVLLDKGQMDEALPFLDTLLHEEPFDGDLPAHIRGLRAEVEGPHEDASTEPEESSPIWPDSDKASGELNWEGATLQRDASQPPPEEEPIREGVSKADSSRLEREGGTVSVVEDGEPIPSPEDVEEALVTSTLGEIYLRQGLFDRAEAVFEQLLEEDPGNEHLRHRLEETRDLLGSQGRTASDWEDEAGETVPADADEDSASSLEFLAPEDSERIVSPPVREGAFEEPDPEDVAGEVDESQIPVVPIESLIPEGVGIGSGRPVSVQALVPDEIPGIEALAPEDVVQVDGLAPEEVLPVEDLAPEEVLSVGALASEEVLPVEDLAPEEVLSVGALASEEVHSIEDLAPEKVLSVEDLAPDESLLVEALAPEAVVSIDDLSPDTAPAGESEGDPSEAVEGDSGDSTVDAFERWLENLQ